MGDLPTRRVLDLTALVILGATGSIGRQTLDVAARLGLEVATLAAGRGTSAIYELADAYPDAAIVIADTESQGDVPPRIARRVELGSQAVSSAARRPGSIVVNGIVGSAGLAPSIAALEAGNRLALANKETLVAGGPLVAAAAAQGGGHIVPVDSEHSALYQCLVGEDRSDVARLILTASGGPFRGKDAVELESVTPEAALAHPTWDMGPRITVDSATMMNKALEIIEAHLLFDIAYDNIDVVVHPQSVVHSLVEFIDGSVKAQLGEPDMRGPIQYAITEPKRAPAGVAPLALGGRALTFEEPNLDAFPALGLGYEAGRRGGIVPAALNAADEVAVAAFLEGRIRFVDISSVVGAVVEDTGDKMPLNVADVLDADAWARRAAQSAIETLDLQS